MFKDSFHDCVLLIARVYWKIFQPRTFGGRVMVVSEHSVLLVKHRRSSKWNLPGGGVKGTEESERGALRELREETGISFSSADFLLGTYSSQAEVKHDTVFVYVKKVTEETVPVVSFEIKEAGWFRFSELPEMTTPKTKKRISEYLEGRREIVEEW